MITIEQLRHIMPNAAKPEVWLQPLNDAMREFNISTPYREAAWLANVATESSQLNVLVENMNYAAEELVKTFSSHFHSLAEASPYAHDQQKIANFVYANEYGNGSPESGDGWKYRGHGLAQFTFKDLYKTASEALGIDLVENPGLLLQPEISARAAGWFWEYKKCETPADHQLIRVVRKEWAGCLQGIAACEKFYKLGLEILL